MTSPARPEPSDAPHMAGGPGRVWKSELPRDGLGRLRSPGEPDAMAHLRGLPDRVPTALEALRRGLALFDEQRFFESYVHLALAWKRTRDPGIRSLVQVAGGLCHVQRDNPDGARAVLVKAAATLRAAEEPTVPGVDVVVLQARVDALVVALDDGGPLTFPPVPRARA